MGHGVRSALITAMLRALIAAESANLQDPGLLMTRVNSDLTAIVKQTGTVLFVTSLYCLFDCDNLILHHARAGHPPPLLARRNAAEVNFASGTKVAAGPALGLFDRAPFITTTTQLSPGDLVLLYTDGIIEAENASGNQWGASRLQKTVQRDLQLTGPKLLEALLAEVRSFTGTTEFADDVCLASVELFA